MKKMIVGMLCLVFSTLHAQDRMGDLLGNYTEPLTLEDSCAIWRCLPQDFPQGCERAQAAAKRRLLAGLSALPNFSQCSKDGQDHGYTHQQRTVYKVEPHQVCQKIEPTGAIQGTNQEVRCSKWVDVAGGWTTQADCFKAGGAFCEKKATLITLFHKGKVLAKATWDIKGVSNIKVPKTWRRAMGDTINTRWQAIGAPLN